MADQTIAGTLSVSDKIGIGIDDPIAQMHVFSLTTASSTSAKSEIFLESDDALLKLSVDKLNGASIGTDIGFSLSIQTGGSSRISITKDGDVSMTGPLTIQNTLTVSNNVNIGTATTSANLQVNGAVRAGDLTVQGKTGISVLTDSGNPAILASGGVSGYLTLLDQNSRQVLESL